ncbi:hypothetical protein ACTODO_02126 [Schaalia dentiphila ATCC 17982]|uniref:Uncharacterized protein n=1 Tax=Schaalia dentiphila ATCC 17982 TaxID=411466 RepID=A7BEM3_9ACTO|nr:hypothetical protein ACTODO_02126 [Schaalia odontolytica ATCC 17982]
MLQRWSKLKRVLLQLKSHMKKESLPSRQLLRNRSGQPTTRRPVYSDYPR